MFSRNAFRVCFRIKFILIKKKHQNISKHKAYIWNFIFISLYLIYLINLYYNTVLLLSIKGKCKHIQTAINFLLGH